MIKTKLTFTHGKRNEIYFPNTTQINKIFEILENHKLNPVVAAFELSEIETSVVSYFRLKDIKTKSRKKTVAYARHIFSYLSYMLCRDSLNSIGKFLNGKDHSTVSHSRDKIIGWISIKDEKVLADLSEIKKMLYSKKNDIKELHPTINALELIKIKGFA